MISYAIEVDWGPGGAWTDESDRVLSFECWAGFKAVRDMVAATGWARIELDNWSERYEPDLSPAPGDPEVRPRKQVRIKASDGVTTWTIWRGFIERIELDAGRWGKKRAWLVCVDGIGLLSSQPVNVAHERSKPVVEAVSEIVELAFTPPATSLTDNGDALENFGRSWIPEETKCIDALRDVCWAVYGRFWMERDGTAHYMTREELQNGRAAPLVLDLTTMLDRGGEFSNGVMDVAPVINRVEATVHPPETIGALTEIWRANNVIHLGPGTRTIGAAFRDDNGERVTALEVADLEAGTDYTINTRRDGKGRDFTSDPDVSVSLAAEASRADLVIENNTGRTLYITLLRVRGKPIRQYDPLVVTRVNEGSALAYGTRSEVLDLWLQDSDSFADGMAAYVINKWAWPQAVAERVTFEDRHDVDGVSLFGIEIMDVVKYVDVYAGVIQVLHRVLSVGYKLDQAGKLRIEFGLEKADDRPYWRLGVEGASELGNSTILGF